MTGRQRMIGGTGLVLCGALLLLAGTIDVGVGVAIGIVGIAVLAQRDGQGASDRADRDARP